jgi:hypothetical protein
MHSLLKTAGEEDRMSLTEDRVKNAVIVKLAKMGYEPRAIKSLTEQGVDIKARHRRYGRFFLVEAKGDPPSSAKNAGSGREVRLLMGLGQLMTRMQPQTGYYYGLALPVSYRATVLRRLHPLLLKHLQLHLFFVDEQLTVEHLRWRDVRGEIGEA